jgi:hypothetical protein
MKFMLFRNRKSYQKNGAKNEIESQCKHSYDSDILPVINDGASYMARLVVLGCWI